MALFVQVKDTPERFRPMADTLVPPLLELLRERSALEREIHDRWEAMDREKLSAGIAYSQIAPGSRRCGRSTGSGI